MKRLLAIMAVSLFVLSACGGGSSVTSKTGTADKNANLVGFLSDFSCKTAEKNGDVTDDEMNKIGAKYGIVDDTELQAAIDAAGAGMTDVKSKVVANIKTQCGDLFTKAGNDPTEFLDGFLKNLAETKDK
ncbi:hypothetical protein HZA40_03290 [Candidatus Peregrinibacteria bacterium]|nr:hypothetical protein [Candidatus Peregrinibacteria bacterium]